ncbi:hypothetical protein [Sulfoacidibacillus thermotolerans]|uniref:Uncharacterized protein n=1 Tax=Sulfoacidibacillus thermotolerans TaxID=1765684 RepID=A0A2U3D809_SULT2|nr:hypothetical protein [Sulfoacidibacillus thermotolerans]PWI57401.1 hypothetical protein BM613_08735 [Sulfoacidibacillus thermotolerans]
MKRLSSLPAQIGVASVLFVLCLFVPLTTSLGQGIHERDLVSWRGIDHLDSGQTQIEFVYQGEPVLDLPLQNVPHKWFHIPVSRTLAETSIDSVSVLSALYKVHPHLVQGIMGTYGNIESITNIFPHYPVSYSTALLKELAIKHINPDQFGGPDIPPGSVPYSMLKDGVLHIDTLPDDNTLVQCAPGAVPNELLTITHQALSGGGASA